MLHKSTIKSLKEFIMRYAGHAYMYYKAKKPSSQEAGKPKTRSGKAQKENPKTKKLECDEDNCSSNNSTQSSNKDSHRNNCRNINDY